MTPSRALALALLFGCARLPVPPPSSPPTPRVAPSPSPLPVARYRYPLARHMVPSHWVDARATPRRAIVRGWRVEVDGDQVSLSDLRFTTPPLAAWEHGGYWFFASRSELWEARSFRGPARLMASAGGGHLGLGSGRVVRIRDGATEGLGLPVGTVLDAAFGDQLHGVALLEPGVLLRTEDGGNHWRQVPLGEAATEVFARGTTGWVRAARCHALEASSPVSAVDCDALPLLGEGLGPLEQTPIDRALGDRVRWEPVAFVTPDRGQLLVRLPIHTLEQQRHPRSAIYDLELDEMLEGSEGEMPCVPLQSFLADHPYVVCAGEDGEHTLWSYERPGQWTERLRTYGCGETPTCAASPDGARVSCSGRCSRDTACSLATVFCERVGTRSPVERVIDFGAHRWMLAGYDGAERVLLDDRLFLTDAQVVRGDGRPVPLMRDPPADHVFSRTRNARDAVRVGRDGVLRFIAAPYGSRRQVALEGHPGGRFTVRAPPPWASPEGEETPFSYCGDDGVAMGRARDGTFWRSLDAADPWRVVPLDAAATNGAPRRGEAWSGMVSCGATRFAAYEIPIDVFGWGRPEPMRAGDLARDLAPRVSERADPSWRCTVEGVTPTPDEEPPVAAQDPSVGPYPWGHRADRWGTHVTLRIDPGASSPARAPRSMRYLLGTGEEAPPDRRWELLSATPQRAVVLSWDPYGDSVAYGRVVVLSPQGPPRRIALDNWEVDPASGSMLTLLAREGPLTAALSHGGGHGGGAPAVVAGLLALRPGAPPRAWRVSVAAAGVRPGVYALDGTAGVARRRPDGSVVGGPPGVFPRVLARSVRDAPCGPSARGAFTFMARVSTSDDPSTARDAVAEYSLDGDSLCLRSLRAPRMVATPSASGVSGLYDGSHPVRCVPE